MNKVNNINLNVDKKNIKKTDIQDTLNSTPIQSDAYSSSLDLTVHPVSALTINREIVLDTKGGAYWNTSGTITTFPSTETTNIYRVSYTPEDKYVPVVAGEKYLYTGSGIWSGTNPAQILFLDDKNSLVSIERNGNKTDYVIIVPENATRMHFTVWSSSKLVKVDTLDDKDKQFIQYDIQRYEHIQRMKRIQYEQTVLRKLSYKPYKKAYITFMMDDTPSEMSSYVDLFASEGLPLCMAIIYERLASSSDNKQESLLEVTRRAVANGGEVLNHRITPITADNINDYDTLYNYFVLSKMKLEKLGFDVNGIILAGGIGQIRGSKITDMWARSYYQYSDLLGIKSMAEPYYHPRNIIGNKTLAEWKSYIDTLDAASSSWDVIYTHGTREKPLAEVRELLKYIKTKPNIEVKTYKEIHDTHIIMDGSTPSVKSLTNISATKTNSNYNVGDTLNTDDITVIATYSDLSTSDVTSRSTINKSGVNISVAGSYNIVVSYTEGTVTKATNIQIIVIESSADNIIAQGDVPDHSGNTIGRWTLSDTGELNLVATNGGAMGNLNSDLWGWYPYKLQIKKIKIEDGFTNIGSNAFANYTELTTVLLSNTVTLLGANAFAGCRNLTSINLINITSFSYYSMRECTALPSEVVLGSATLVANVFYKDVNITTIKFIGTTSSIDVNAFKHITAYNSSTNLTDIYVPWSEGAVAYAPWGATSATIHYNYVSTP